MATKDPKRDDGSSSSNNNNNNNFVASTQELLSLENPNLFLAAGRLFQQHYPPKFLNKVIAEIIATYLLVFVTCGSAALSASDEHKVSKLGASIAGGLIVTVMIYAVGHISGAHMNPAVTIAFASARHFPWKQVPFYANEAAHQLAQWALRVGFSGFLHGVPFYAVAQLTGATASAFTLRVLLNPIKHLGTTSPSGAEIQALVTEIVVTFNMMFVTLAVATDTKAIGELAGLAVGCAVCITSILAGPISGGSMNPARSIGPAIASAYYKGIWVYIIGPVTGTLMGAWSYKLIRVTENHSPAISSRSISFKFRRPKCNDEQNDNKDPLETDASGLPTVPRRAYV